MHWIPDRRPQRRCAAPLSGKRLRMWVCSARHLTRCLVPDNRNAAQWKADPGSRAREAAAQRLGTHYSVRSRPPLHSRGVTRGGAHVPAIVCRIRPSSPWLRSGAFSKNRIRSRQYCAPGISVDRIAWSSRSRAGDQTNRAERLRRARRNERNMADTPDMATHIALLPARGIRVSSASAMT